MLKKNYCYHCDSVVESEKQINKNTYSFRGKDFYVKETILFCPTCKNELLQDDMLDNSLNNIYNEYLKLFNLSFEKIKRIRKDLKLTQEQMSKILGWSKKSIVRYENAESIPQGEYLNTYMTLNDNPFYLIKVLERNKNMLDEDEYYKLLESLPFYDEYKIINSVLYLLDDNSLYETSLMKNMFVADFDNCKEYGDSITGLEYVHMPYGPVVNNRNELYNLMLKNNYLEIELIENSTKFKSVHKYDKNLFSSNELKTLSKVKNKLKKYNATKLSEWSHKFEGWKKTSNGQIISYEYAKHLNIDEL